MTRSDLAAVSLEVGLCLWRRLPAFGGLQERRDWLVIGRVGGSTPFLLSYAGLGVANWWCEERLGDSMRKKVLRVFREEVRQAGALPSFVALHDLRDDDEKDFETSSRRAGEIHGAFFKDVWRAGYLGDRDDDYVALKVPFAEKDAAKALGARWKSETRTWVVKRQDDMSAFARWMDGQAAPA